MLDITPPTRAYTPRATTLYTVVPSSVSAFRLVVAADAAGKPLPPDAVQSIIDGHRWEARTVERGLADVAAEIEGAATLGITKLARIRADLEVTLAELTRRQDALAECLKRSVAAAKLRKREIAQRREDLTAADAALRNLLATLPELVATLERREALAAELLELGDTPASFWKPDSPVAYYGSDRPTFQLPDAHGNALPIAAQPTARPPYGARVSITNAGRGFPPGREGHAVLPGTREAIAVGETLVARIGLGASDIVGGTNANLTIVPAPLASEGV